MLHTLNDLFLAVIVASEDKASVYPKVIYNDVHNTQKILLCIRCTNEVVLHPNSSSMCRHQKKKARRWTEILFEVFLLLLLPFFFSTFDAMAFSMTEKGGRCGWVREKRV